MDSEIPRWILRATTFTDFKGEGPNFTLVN